MAESLKDDLRRAADLERLEYEVERGRFIERASRTASPHTRRAYRATLARLEAWCRRRGIAPLDVTPALADDWIEAEKAEGASPATVRIRVSGCSTFWTWLERRHSELRNPFRGTRSRPLNRPTRRLAVPSAEEIAELEAAAGPVLRAAITLMARTGLRVGALPGLAIRGDRYTTTTKGREQAGPMPEDVRRQVGRAGLSLRAPFADVTAGNIADRVFYLAKKLHAAGKLQARYSVHDLRHAFVVRLY